MQIGLVLGVIPACAGIYFLGGRLLRLPERKVCRAMAAAMGAINPEESELERLIGQAADSISRNITLDESKEANWKLKLHAAGISLSPQQYLAKALVKGLLLALFAPLFLLFAPGMAFIPFAAGVIAFLNARGEADRRIGHRVEEIEEELPRFVDTIEKNLKMSRDIVSILENYRRVAGPVMAEELGVTLADMRSGNPETALMRFELRVGSAFLGEVCRGLISVLQGDDTAFYWAQLSMKLKESRREFLRRKAMELPKKISRLSLVVMFCFLLLYIVVIFYETVQSLSVLFT